MSGTIPASNSIDFSVSVDISTLAEGQYSGSFSVTPSSTAYDAVLVSVSLSVSAAPPVGEYANWISTSSDRSNAILFNSQVLSGNVYIFLLPELAAITRVEFFLDDPTFDQDPYKIERNAPYDLQGTTNTGAAIPFDTSMLQQGSHLLTTRVILSDGTFALASSSFSVSTGSSPFLIATPSSVALLALPSDPPVSAFVEISTSDGAIASFTATADQTWISVVPSAGSINENAVVALEIIADASQLSAGSYTAVVSVDSSSHDTLLVQVSLTVVADSQTFITQVHLTWQQSTALSNQITVTYHSQDPTVPSVVEYRLAGSSSSWIAVQGALRNSGTEQGELFVAELTNLSPDTEYEYRILASTSGTYSDVFVMKTARSVFPLRAVFVSDTGLIGRLDGLDTGALVIRDALADLDVDLVLLGGDYSYFNTDRRFETFENTMDEWFRQWQPVLSRRPGLPVWGNHETGLGENLGGWSQRFPVPPGLGNPTRQYSFDVANVHFLTIFTPGNPDSGFLTDAEVQWVRNDIQNARLAGTRWIVPYMHVPSFGDGTNHRANQNVRGQLGPIFTEFEIPLVLTSHDQAYERSLSLTDITQNGFTIVSEGRRRCINESQGGVSYMKISPGGKLSNRNLDFSEFGSSVPPAWTAFRAREAHVFSIVEADTNSLEIQTFGILGRFASDAQERSTPFLLDTFRIAPGFSCQELETNPLYETISIQSGSTTSRTIQVFDNASNSAVDFSIEPPNASWLSVTNIQTGTFTISIDASELQPALYHTSITLVATNYQPEQFHIFLTV
eukprot:CAMPEP_0182446420 /NCGR_PEP_ID=MMETSP1172-20130603/4193_1 /TAXON_ID=708627 /ORGANISM="Timspurckia oligopyrenoides, Strain CCMP3278" /LENGTH=790 /DNA_ID=CAMNT_0024642349 /DNA_START=180 /DNA_END=2552 /DNA_ORIENTATION=-